jgi:predicted amidophosphoribosyltransferase
VLVVDDVTTTGSTLSEVAAALRAVSTAAGGTPNVYTLAIARED